MHNLVIQQISDWLWNQMFQYAYVRALSLRNNIDFLLDLHNFWYQGYPRKFELERFNIKKYYLEDEKAIPFYEFYEPGLIRWLLWRLNPYHYIESYYEPLKFNKKYLKIKSWYIVWAFISEKYFCDKWNIIKDDFKFIWRISSKTKMVQEMIEKKNCVSIHFRRWDYIDYPDIYPVLSDDYYKLAIKMINELVENPVFVVFSDDIEYARSKLSNYNNVMFVEHNRWDDSWQDMYLMSKCKHNITAHSTFSWWWAYLNDNENKIVISPSKWFVDGSRRHCGDIVPSSWIVI